MVPQSSWRLDGVIEVHVLQLPEKRLEAGKNGRRETFAKAGKDMAGLSHPISQVLCIPNQLGQNPGTLQAGDSVRVRQEWTSPQGLQKDPVLEPMMVTQ